jgi:Peptidase A4 family
MNSKGSARLFVLAAGVSALALAAPAANAAPVSHTAQQSVHQVSASVASHESHRLQTVGHATKNAVESGNWSGYAATTSTYTSVQSSWVQPTINCSSGRTTYSSYWVGLDGYNNSALEQTGTEADCIGGTAEYGAWWEVLPAAESPYSVTVRPGDHLTATVTYIGSSNFTMTLADSTEGWTKTTTHKGSSGFQNTSAEVIAEATSVGGQIANLSNFGSVSFTGSTANGTALGSLSPTEIIMVGSGGDTTAQPGGISGGNFGVTWENYS